MSSRSEIIARNVVRHRKAAGLSQAELAKTIGVKSQNTIATIELGKTEQSKHLAKIAQVLKVRMADIDPQFAGEETVRIDRPTVARTDQLGVYASVEGGDGEIVFSNEPVQHVPMPKALMGVRKAYGVIVKGESMVPLVRPGYTVWINPHLPPRPLDICLFFHERDGEFTATIKEFCGQNSEVWQVKRYQPKERRFTLPKRDWPGCHVVVGTDYGR